MLDNILNTIKRCKDKILFLPKSDIEYSVPFKYMYGDIIALIDDSVTDYMSIVDEINKSTIKEIYIVNFPNIYRKMLPGLNKDIIKKELLLINAANLTSKYILPVFYDVCEFYDRHLIDEIHVLDKGLYEAMKHANYNVERLNLKFEYDENEMNLDNKSSNSIGILSIDYDPVHNFYNMLSSIRLVNDYDKVKLISHMNATIDFFNHFDIRHELCENLDQVIKDNYVNLYCNFTNTNPCIVIKSMDMGIPCILGNTDMFDNNKFLKDKLVLKSDDDVGEIADKINAIKKNYDKIFMEYRKWRKTNDQ